MPTDPALPALAHTLEALDLIVSDACDESNRRAMVLDYDVGEPVVATQPVADAARLLRSQQAEIERLRTAIKDQCERQCQPIYRDYAPRHAPWCLLYEVEL